MTETRRIELKRMFYNDRFHKKATDDEIQKLEIMETEIYMMRERLRSMIKDKNIFKGGIETRKN